MYGSAGASDGGSGLQGAPGVQQENGSGRDCVSASTRSAMKASTASRTGAMRSARSTSRPSQFRSQEEVERWSAIGRSASNRPIVLNHVQAGGKKKILAGLCGHRSLVAITSDRFGSD